ncbi:MAG: 30S ribosomal protein S6, partial [Patescibacteria group bacterium]
MNNYELTYLLKPEMTKKEISTLSEKINSFIQSQKGVIEKNLPEQTKTLGYPIQNSKNVFLKTVVFSYNPKVLLLLDKYLKEEKSIVR